EEVTKFSKWKVPPTGGQARRNKLLVSWGPLVIAPPLAGSLLAPLRCGWTVRVPMPSDFATFKIPTPFAASCFRTFRSVALSIFGRPSFTPCATARFRPALIRQLAPAQLGADVMRAQYHAAGFRILEWMNYSNKVIEHYERTLSAPRNKLTNRLILGED